MGSQESTTRPTRLKLVQVANISGDTDI
jgi:hypothetical protein